MGALKLVKPFIYKYKFYLLLYTIAVLLTYPLESVIVPKLFSTFIKNIEKDVSNTVFINFFKRITIFMIIITIGQQITSRLDIFLIPNFNESVTNNFYEKIMKYYENNYTDLELGKILTKINILPSILRELTTDLFNWVIPKLFTVIIINCYFFKFSKLLGIVSISTIIIILMNNVRSCHPCIKKANDRYNVYENKSEYIQDKLSNLFSIYSNGNISNEINDFKKESRKFKIYHHDSVSCNNTLKCNNALCTTILFLSLNCYIVYLFKLNKITREQLVTLFMILIFYVPCLNNIFTYLPDYINHIGIISSVDDFIDTIYIENKAKPDISITDGYIEIKNLIFSYNDKNTLFNNFNLVINSKDKLGIVGPSGNGKSTLIKLIMGYFKVPENTIFIDGQDINKCNLTSLRKQITYINQNTKLFNKTIYENIMYGNNIIEKDIDDVYNKYNLQTVFGNIQSGFNTSVGVNGDILSGGQKQIILLLRNYFKNNKIVILDEPTSALDPKTRLIVLQLIKDISVNSTLVIITHDENNLEITQRKIKIINGEISN